MRKFFIAIFLTLSTITIFAQQKIFIRVEGTPASPGIKGESVDASHPGWIEADAFAETVEVPVSIAGGTGAGVGKPSNTPFTFSICTDKSLNNLRSRFFRGVPLTNVNIEYVTTGQTSFVYYKILLEDAYITKIEEGGASGDKNRVNISITPSRVRYTYNPRLPNGAADTPVVYGWDYVGNRAF